MKQRTKELNATPIQRVKDICLKCGQLKCWGRSHSKSLLCNVEGAVRNRKSFFRSPPPANCVSLMETIVLIQDVPQPKGVVQP